MEGIAQKLQVIKNNYIMSLPGKLAELQAMFDQFRNEDSVDIRGEFHRMAHTLTGTAATFDQIDLSLEARKLETLLKDLIESDHADISTSNTDTHSQIEKYIVNISSHINSLDSGASNIAEPSTDIDAESILDTVVKILITDDNDHSRQHLKILLENAGHTVIEAVNGIDAIEKFKATAPDIILMDVVMPEMDGLAATREIKKLNKNNFTPIIFLTAITDNAILHDCIDVGGDDFLSKPYDILIILSKIRSLLRIRNLTSQLQEYQRINEEEIHNAKKIFGAVLNRDEARTPEGLKIWSQANHNFSGDVQLSTLTNSGDAHVFLGDMTGHGLPAAVGTVLAAEIFYEHSTRGAPTSEMLMNMNQSMYRILPSGWFCATLSAKFHSHNNTLELWNFGMSDALIVNKDMKIIHKVSSSSPALGCLSSKDLVTCIQPHPELFEIKDDMLVLLMSDGITEARNADGKMLGDEQLEEIIASSPSLNEIFETIQTKLNHYTNGIYDDDVSLIAFPISPNSKPEQI